MSGLSAQRGFIYQTLIAMIECFERDDWDKVKLEPASEHDKVDIQLYQNGSVLKAIQVKSSQNKFGQKEVERWLDAVRADAADAQEIAVYLVGDLYTSTCQKYIASSSEIKTYPFASLDLLCSQKLQKYIIKEGRGNQIDEDELRIAYNNLFAEIHNNSIKPEPFTREEFRGWLLRVLSFPKCLTTIPGVNRDVGLIGREDELHNARRMLESAGCVALISGIGGIGKTAVMRWVCNNIVEDGNARNHVAWISCGGSLEDDLLLLRDALGIALSGSNAEDYQKVLYKLRNFRGTLYLFMDNMSRIPSAEEMNTMNSLRPSVHIMITARHKMEGIPTIDLVTLMPDAALDMFYKYYSRDLNHQYESSARKIVDSVHRHTLLVELLARAAGRSGGSLEDFHDNLNQKGFFDVFARAIHTKHDDNLTIEESVINLYEIAGLSEEQQRIMKLFTIFTPEKEIYWKICKWADFDMEALDELVDLAWLQRGGLENGFFIHQIISDSLKRQLQRLHEEVLIEEYDGLFANVSAVNDYIPSELEFSKAQERLTLAEDISHYLTVRSKELLNRPNLSEVDRWFLIATTNHYSNLAFIYYNLGYYEAARKLYTESIELSMQFSGTDTAQAATLYINIANTMREQADYENALTYYAAALDIRKKVLGPHDPDTGMAYSNMALAYTDLGKYKEALDNYKKALAIIEPVLSADHPDKSNVYNNMAVLYSNLGKYSDALEYHEKALNILKANTVGETAEIAKAYNNIALVLTKQHKYDEAEEYYKKAVTSLEYIGGPEHPDIATVLNNVALMYADQKDSDNALVYYRKALDIAEKALGTEHPMTSKIYDNMASTYSDQGNYNKALEFAEKALSCRERVLGPNHPDTAISYNNIGVLCLDQDDYAQALEYYEKAYAVFMDKLGAENEHTQNAQDAITYIKEHLQTGISQRPGFFETISSSLLSFIKHIF